MRKIYKKIEVKNRVYKKAYKSTYSKNINWRIILPNEVYEKMIDSVTNVKPEFNFNDEKGLYILSLISSIPSYKKDKYYAGGYVNISSKLVRNVVSNYTDYLSYFIENEIIEVNESYSNSDKKKFCKSFRYNLKGIKKLTWNIFEFDILKKTYDKILINEKAICSKPEHLTKWLNNELSIDSDAVLIEIQERLKYISSEENNTLKKAENYLRSLKNLHFGEYWANRSPKDNRLHTNLTNMPEFFRKHIRLDDWNMAEVDFKNSQPFFLIVVLDSIMNIGKEESNNRIIKLVEKIGISGTMLQTLTQTLNSKGFQEEYSKIKADVLNGTLYDNLERFFEFDKNIENKFMRKFYCKDSERQKMYFFDEKRDVVKRLILFFLYKANKKSEKQEDKDYLIFKNLYPNFCHVLELLKEKNSKDLPKLLQHIEADCILDFTTKKIAEKYPNIPLYTIHDSIITTENYIDIIETETKQYVKEYCLGLLPKLKTKFWCEECEILKSA